MIKRAKYTTRNAKRKGRLDGKSFTWQFWPFIKNNKMAYPIIDQAEPAQYEDELLRLADSEIAEIAEVWKGKDRLLKANYCDILSQRERAFERFEKEEKEVAPEEANLRKIDEEMMNFPEPGIQHWIAVIFHFIIFASEIFFNAIVFNSFGFEHNDTIVVAGGLGLGFTLCAYSLGKLLKKDNKSKSDVLWIYVIPVIVLLALISVSVLRGSYLKDVEKITHVHFSMSPFLASILFFFLNILLFGAGALISYASFSKDEGLRQTLKKRYRHAIKRLKKEKKEAKKAAEEFEEIDKKYMKAKHFRQKEFERLYTQAKTTKEIAEFLVSVYRVANMEKRADSIKPNCFKIPPRDIVLPEDILPANLDWNCHFKTI
ncbi:MAG: hypothetical protein KA530_11890 [Ferruginibacter sp.]|nr:hypothetical protein [Ferruginibacter sp.]